MKILAVEFSSEQRSIAVLDGEKLFGLAVETGGRAVISLVERALQEAKTEREQIECLALGIGPGSYTGIRGAIALAQGWQLGRAVKTIGISSVECLAAQAQTEKISGLVNIVVDAQRNEFYLASYQITPAECLETTPLHLASLAEIEKLAQAGEAILGPDIAQWFPSAKNIYPNAATLGRLAASRTNFVTADKIEPIYLRETAFKKAPPQRTIL